MVLAGVNSVVEGNCAFGMYGAGNENVGVVDNAALLFECKPKMRGVRINRWLLTDVRISDRSRSASSIYGAQEV